VSRAAALAFCVCLLAAGCGGRTASAPPPPRLPHPLAQRLAAASDGVASALAAGDACAALDRATALQHTVIAAINGHRVPPVFQEPLLGAVNSLAERIRCVPPPPPPPAPVADDRGHHGHHGHHEHHGRGDD
jgi:hypothetical protein